MSADSKNELVYRIDAGGTIIEVNDRWEEFWRANAPHGAPMPRFVGTRLWSHVGNRTLMHFYQALVAKVRRTGNELVVPFRCDSPEARRYMEMRIRRLSAGVVEFRTLTVRQEGTGTPGTAFLTGATSRYSREFVRMCSWCRRVAAPDWVEVEEAIRRLKLFELEEIPRVTHAICEDCGEVMRKEIQGLKPRQP
jgi:hypothetical protein